VHHVCGVEQLSYSGVNVTLCLCLRIGPVRDCGVVRKVENHVLAGIWAVVVDVRVLAFPVLLREDLKRPIK
jgi:hypothetical protein